MPNWRSRCGGDQLFAPGEARDKLREAVASTTDGETPPEDAKGLLKRTEDGEESTLSATETEAATSAYTESRSR